jgi:SAM-dependent methyltransferase
MPRAFVCPTTGETLTQDAERLVRPSDGRVVATRVDGRWRFVPMGGAYAASFGWQWRRWSRALSQASSGDRVRLDTIMQRTGFGRYDLAGKSLLECGSGCGNDTEVLQRLPLGEICSFDLTRAIDATTADTTDPRLTLFQADLNAIPYPDASFDVVYCHRVLQHTPDPEASLRAIVRKVKPGGIVFAHCYNSTPLQDRQYHHKYRWLTRRLPCWMVAALLTITGPASRLLWQELGVKKRLGPKGWDFCFSWVPLHFTHTQYDHLGPRRRRQIEKLITFDRLTAWHENHMTGSHMRRVLEEEGFRVESLMCDQDQPVWATAVRKAQAPSVRVPAASMGRTVAA